MLRGSMEMPKQAPQWPLTKRAGRACLSCRARKVKCNVEEQGQPCSNCVTDEAVCRVQKSKRGRKPAIDGNKNPRKRQAVSGALDSPEVNSGRLTAKHTPGWLPDYGHDSLDNGLLSIASARDEEAIPRDSRGHLDFDARFLHQELTYVSLIDKAGAKQPPNSEPSIPDLASTDQTSPSVESIYISPGGLPDYIKPLPSKLSAEDMDYLRLKGALDLPSDGFRRALIQSYISYVHPIISFIDLSIFLRHDEPNEPKISILLLQAALFTAMAFVDIKEIKKAGFPSRRVARKTFYHKVKLLYDLDAEADRLTTIQAALLMTYWNETPGDPKGGWHWIGVAVSLAQTLGMHRNIEYAVPSPRSRLCKRLWWSLYYRDRMMGLGMARPFRIKDTDFNTPMLTLDDFDIHDYSNEAGMYDVPSTQCQTVVAGICINLAELCTIISAVLELHYTILPGNAMALAKDKSGDTGTLLFLKNEPPSSDAVEVLDQRLEGWLRNLPPSSIYNSSSMESREPVAEVQQAFIQTIFWSLLSVLHRPQLRGQAYTSSQAAMERSTKRIEEARLAVFKINRSVNRRRLAQYLPPTALTLQVPVMIANIQQLQKDHHRHLDESLSPLFECFKIVETLQSMYVGADLVMPMTMELLRKMDIMLLMGPDSNCRGLTFHKSPIDIPGPLPQIDRVRPAESVACSTIGSHSNENASPAPSVALGSGSVSAVDSSVADQKTFSSTDAIDFAEWDPPAMAFDEADFEQAFGMMVDFDYLQFMEGEISP